VYSKVYLEPQTTLDMMEGICHMEFQGRLMAIYNTNHKKYLEVIRRTSNDKYSEVAKTAVEEIFFEMSLSKKFVVFFDNDRVDIFSLDHAGYVFASAKKEDDYRSRVYGYESNIDPPEKQYWQVEELQDYLGKVYIKNIHYNEYLYASKNNYKAYTWQPGDTKKEEGIWIFEDLKVSGDVKRIRSVSSGNYLKGRATINDGKTIVLSKLEPEYPHYYDWYLIKLGDGIYNIKSKTSNMYLDGRPEGIGNGPHVCLWHLSDKKARTLNFFKWQITEHMFEGHKRYAIQSVSSRLYLDGRNPEHVGSNMLYLRRSSNPQGDKYFMWDLLEKDEEE